MGARIATVGTSPRWDKVSVGLAAYIGALLAWLASGVGDPSQRTFISDLAPCLPALAVPLLCARAAREPRLDPRARRSWWLLALASTFYGAGDVAWFVAEGVFGNSPFPSLADVSFLASYPIAIAALFLFPATTNRKLATRAILLIDATAFTLAGVVVVWFLVLAPLAQAGSADLLTGTVSGLFAAFDIAILFSVAVAVLGGRTAGPLRFVLLGFLLIPVGDTVFGFLAQQGGHGGDGLADAIAWLTFGLGARLTTLQARKGDASGVDASEADAFPLASRGILLLPYVAIAGAIALLLLHAARETSQPDRWLTLGAIVVTALLTARQALTVRANSRLVAATARDTAAAEFERLVIHGADFMLVHDATLAIRYASPNLWRVLGWPERTVTAESIVSILESGEFERVQAHLASVFAGPSDSASEPLEVRFRRQNGQLRTLEGVTTKVIGEGGEPLVIVNARDVTERVNALAALRESEANVRALVAGIPDQIIRFDADGRVADVMGARPDGAVFTPERIGRTLDELVPPELARLARDAHARAVEGGRTEEISFAAPRPDGLHNFDARVVALPDGGALGIIRDVTDRQVAVDALRQSEAHLQALLNGMPDPAFRFDREGRFLEKLGGHAPGTPFAEHSVGRTLNELLPAPLARRLMVAIDRALREGRTRELSHVLQRPDGPHHYETRVSPLAADGEVLAIMRDVTDRVLATDALARKEARLRAIVSAIPDQILRVDRDGRFLELLGTPAPGSPLTPEVAGRMLEELLPRAVLDPALAAIAAALAQREPQTLSLVSPRPDGLHSFEATIVPLSDVEVIAVVHDVTERVVAAETIQRNEARLRAIVDALPDKIVRLDRDARFLEVLGVPVPGSKFQPGAIGQTMAELAGPDTARRWLDGITAALAENRPHMITTSRPRPDGIHHIETTIVPISDSEVVAVLHDITERVVAAETIQRNEARLRAIVDALPDTIVRLDRDSRFLEVLGAPVPGSQLQPELTGRTLDQLLPPDLARLYGDALSIALADRATQTISYATPRPDGLHSFETRIASYSESEVIALIRDVTEATDAKARAERLVHILDATPDVVYSSTEDGRLVYANAAFHQLVGVPDGADLAEVAEALAQFGDLTSTFSDTIRPAAARDGYWHGDLDFDALDGRHVPVSMVVLAHRAPDGSIDYFSGIGRDITQWRRSEAELLAAKDVAEAANRAKSDFLATMSHEIRTPMNGIIGAADLLLDAELSDEQRDYAETMRESSEALLGIINDILDFSKIEANRLELEIVEFDLRATVEGVCTVLGSAAHRHGLELIEAIHPDVPSAVLGDPGRVRQVLSNLVANAIKFTEAGEVVVRVAPDGLADGRANVRFEVSDTGIGIDPDAQARLFKPFTQGDPTMSRRYGGTGLGLAISRQLVELMGGEIGVVSRAGEGSTFWFTASFDRVAGAVPSAPHHELSGARILVIDPNPTSRAVILQLLAGWNLRAEPASHGPEAIRALCEADAAGDPFAAAIVDEPVDERQDAHAGLAMPCPIDAPTPPIILVSSTDRPRLASHSTLPIVACLAKPLHASNLLNALSDIVHPEGRRAGRTAAVDTLADCSILRSTATILLVEDHATNQKVALGILHRLGYRADLAVTGLEALAATERAAYDLILMDCQLPGLDGLEATELIRARDGAARHPVIVALTANATADDRARCLAAGMDDYLPKPIRRATLRPVLERWLSSGREGSRARAVAGVVELDGVAGSSDGQAGADPVDDGLLDLAALAEIRALDEDGSDDGFDSMLDLFLDGAAQHVAAISHAADRGDEVAIERESHALKGTSLSIGARKLGERAAQMCAAAKTGDARGRGTMIDDLEATFMETRLGFQAYRETIRASDVDLGTSDAEPGMPN
jgi:PAS domain S-box-containing protein